VIYRSRPTAIIIGAGPFGLSIAAHLRYAGINFRIFGTPMRRWLTQMPKGMFLKSEGCASSLSDPAGQHTLARYCAQNDLPYREYGMPVSLETFTRYALSFQHNLVPTVEDVMVTRLDKSQDEFELQLANGETARASNVIVATGLAHTAYIPTALASLPSALVSHSADHDDLTIFRRKDVVVIGGGQSALETATLAHEAGASVRVLARQPSIAWNPTPILAHRPRWKRIRYPMSNLGLGLGTWIYANAPPLFYRLPRSMRVERVRTALGPAGAWWLRDRLVGRLPVLTGHIVREAEIRGDQVLLRAQAQDGSHTEFVTDHVIAATGYRFSLSLLPFLSPPLLSELRHFDQKPRLSPSFESSVPGLYFSGLASANNFGPVMRFVAGADFTARCLAGHLAKRGRRRSARPARAPKCAEF
jgi:thioredoxin reductase